MRTSTNLHLNSPVENIDNRMRIMPVDRVDGSWGVIDSNDFNLFTRYFRKLFRKERIHLPGMHCRGKSEGKDQKRSLGNALSILISCLLFGRETHASTTQSDPLLLPTRNGLCREDGALHWEYLS